MLSILVLLPCVCVDFDINSTPLPTIVHTLSDSDAAGAAKRLSNENSTIVRFTTSTTVPLRTHQALVSAFSCHINRLSETHLTTAPTLCVLNTATYPNVQSSDHQQRHRNHQAPLLPRMPFQRNQTRVPHLPSLFTTAQFTKNHAVPSTNLRLHPRSATATGSQSS